MRKRFTVLCIMGIVFATLAKANAEGLKVNVPFNFVVNGKELPAATYTVRESLANDNLGLAFLGQGTGALSPIPPTLRQAARRWSESPARVFKGLRKERQ